MGHALAQNGRAQGQKISAPDRGQLRTADPCRITTSNIPGAKGCDESAMPDQRENRSTTADPGPPDRRPDIGSARHDFAGHPIEQTAGPRVSDGCTHFATQSHGAGAARCARQTLADPTSIVPITLALIGGILIIGGALTSAGKGPGKLIKPHPRRRGASLRSRKWRRRLGFPLIAVGLACLALIFV